ncbi:unnamed protein product [Leptosia nina]|uniref:Secreted protein n=1 Tax=Leptosia nina TaxID=320188 RepID=A0AAV1JK72_9NEOP
MEGALCTVRIRPLMHLCPGTFPTACCAGFRTRQRTSGHNGSIKIMQVNEDLRTRVPESRSLHNGGQASVRRRHARTCFIS